MSPSSEPPCNVRAGRNAFNRASGRIGLLKHHGIARFRNIEIKELPPTKLITVEKVNPAEQPKEPAASDLAKAKDAFAAAIQKAEKNVPAALDREIDALAKAKLNAEERLVAIDILKAEKGAFERNGTIPWSPLGRGVLTGKYRHGRPADSRAASPHFELRTMLSRSSS